MPNARDRKRKSRQQYIARHGLEEIRKKKNERCAAQRKSRKLTTSEEEQRVKRELERQRNARYRAKLKRRILS